MAYLACRKCGRIQVMQCTDGCGKWGAPTWSDTDIMMTNGVLCGDFFGTTCPSCAGDLKVCSGLPPPICEHGERLGMCFKCAKIIRDKEKAENEIKEVIIWQ